ncbi:hypothetical protein RN001_006546 [Aquatica leii]|uniref:Major facilitator superfamily (MFS) profile domain-containing protein n=1 Tax=Aquatica leii TaxID=1421715 RepID=A0AAN7PDP2_9COLE|nr:hypothetical protein RN001_006546 [Aquatica leii]
MYQESEKSNVRDSEKPTYGSNGNNDNDVIEPEEVDILEKIIGGFGIWQFKITLLLSLLKIPSAWTQLSIVFIAPHVEFWCKPPNEFANLPVHKWKSIIAIADDQFNNNTYKSSCYMKNVVNNNTNTTILPCIWGYEYNKTYVSSSIITEWDLVCEKQIMVEITQTTTMLGILLGMLMFGAAADTFGRRNVLLVAIMLHILCGLLSTISPWYSIFLFFKFLSAWASSGLISISFVMCLEVVAGSWRTSVSILTLIPWGLGYSILAIIAYFVRDWRYLQLAQFISCFFFFSYYWLIPESPRWLLTVNRKKEAIEILKQAAIENKKDVDGINKMVKEYKEDIKADSVSIIHIFRYSILRKRALILSLKWFTNGIVYFGLYQLSGTITENIYLSVIFVGLISVPGNFCAVVIVKKYGRKISLAVANIVTAICLFCVISISKSSPYYMWLENLFLGLAIFGLTISYPTLHLLSGECYPTVLRNSTVSMNMMCSKLGGMLSPFIVSWAHTNWQVPYIVFGITSVIEIFPLFFLPETLKMKLPDSIEDVENS